MSAKSFEKHRLSFTSHQGKMVFGKNFKSGRKAAVQTASRLLLSDHLMMDGSIDKSHISYLEDADLWSYIYYLYAFNNEHIPEFTQMKGDDGLASAERFYDVVKSMVERSALRIQYRIERLSIGDLILFIDKIVAKHSERLVNPVVDHYNEMLLKTHSDSVRNIDVVVRTGREAATVVSEPQQVKDSDIVISFGVKRSNNID